MVLFEIMTKSNCFKSFQKEYKYLIASGVIRYLRYSIHIATNKKKSQLLEIFLFDRRFKKYDFMVQFVNF
jgi:hypothetical protein